ncbi:MAG TPA: hypothetical protein VNC50_09030 [Planctomycetia bacterium]|nr:hypothetical protein [Planctomycetia bacterium]
MDSEVRHELERNSLEIKLVEMADWLRGHVKLIAVIAAGVVVAWGAWRYSQASAVAARAASWNDFYAGDYEEVIKKHPASEAARYARMRLADDSFKAAQGALIDNREQALKDFEKAIGNYENLAADSGAPPALRRRALFAKAVAIESRGAPEKATEAYKAVAQQYKDTEEGMRAEHRIRELARKSASDFYRQLVEYKPAISPPKLGGSDPLNLDFMKGPTNSGSGVVPPPAVAPPVLGKDAPPNPKDVPVPPKMDGKKDPPKSPPAAPGADLPPPGTFDPKKGEKKDDKSPPKPEAKSDAKKDAAPAPPAKKDETKK